MSSVPPSPAGNAAASVDAAADRLAALSVSSGPSAKGELTLESLAARIGKREFKRIVVLTGAGVSTSAGIPDFRGPTGLYANLQKYNLPHPTAVFELNYFRHNPAPFFMLAKELYPGVFRPTPAHFFIRALEEHGVLCRNLTQNIDSLEVVAGLNPHKLIQAHGGFSKAKCIDCNSEYPEAFVKHAVMSDRIPRCERKTCGGLVKPAIVFFGEGLPPEFFTSVQRDLPAADLLIVMGTSLTVQPFASLITRVANDCPRLLINMHAAGESEAADDSDEEEDDRADGGFNFQRKDNCRDLFLQGDCDTGVRTLAKLIGPDFAAKLEQLIDDDRRAHPAAPAQKLPAAAEADKVARAIAQAAQADTVEASAAAGDASSSSAPAASLAPFAVGFDVDHTLLHDNGLELGALQLVAADVGHADVAHSADFTRSLQHILQEFRDGVFSDQLELMRRFAAAMGGLPAAESPGSLQQRWHQHCFARVQRATADPGALELLRWLTAHGIPYAIYTNGWSPLQEKKAAHVLGALTPPADRLLVSDLIPDGIKPAAGAWKALRAVPGFAGMPAERIFYVGDNPVGDVGGALRAGFKAIFVDAEQQAYPEDQPPPTLRAANLTEVQHFLEQQLKRSAAAANL